MRKNIRTQLLMIGVLCLMVGCGRKEVVMDEDLLSETVTNENVGDYSFDYYVCAINGETYPVAFTSNQEYNTSKIEMARKHIYTSDGKTPEYYAIVNTPNGLDVSGLSEEAALQKAKDFFNSVGVKDMDLQKTSYVQMGRADSTTEMNGFCFFFSRAIGGNLIDNNRRNQLFDVSNIDSMNG